MKKLLHWGIFSTLCIVFILSTALAQQPAGPQLFLEKYAFDAQVVKEGEIIEHIFPVFNKGDSTLEIQKVKPG
jgi:hypothetical protein